MIFNTIGGDKSNCIASYLAFVGNVNADMIDAAFGKNNEDLIKNLGLQLAMYAWYKGFEKENYTFTNLRCSETLNDIFSNINAIKEVFIESTYIYNNDSPSTSEHSDLKDRTLPNLFFQSEYVKSTHLLQVFDEYKKAPGNSTSDSFTYKCNFDPSKKYLCNLTGKVGTKDSTVYGFTFVINGVNQHDIRNLSSLYYDVLYFIDLEQAGITEPGEYDIVLKNMYGTKSKSTIANIDIYEI